MKDDPKQPVDELQEQPAVEQPVEAADQAPEQNQNQVQSDEHVTYHLDRDPNDPRTATPAGKLPSLDDEDQK